MKEQMLKDMEKYVLKTMSVMIFRWYSTYGTPPETSIELLETKKRNLWQWFQWSLNVRDEYKKLFV